MNKVHVVVIGLLLAASAGFGVVAATKTAGLRTTTKATVSAKPSGSIAARARRLNRVEASLRRALRKKPPALPAVPAVRHAAPVAAAPAAAQPQIIYHRPPPIVVVKHRAGGEDEHESEGGGGDD